MLNDMPTLDCGRVAAMRLETVPVWNSGCLSGVLLLYLRTPYPGASRLQGPP